MRLTQDVVHRTIMRGTPCTLHDEHGLLLKISPRKRGWYRQYRLPGRDPATGKRRAPKLYFLGDYGPDFRLAEARRESTKVDVRVKEGHDPLAERHAAVTTELVRTDTMTVSGLVASFVADRSDRWRPNTVKAFAADLARIKSALGSLCVADVTRARLALFLQDFVVAQQKRNHLGTMAQRLRGLFGSLFGYAIELDLITASPAIKLRLPVSARHASRERTLTADEIVQTWRTLDGRVSPIALILQISLATGARIGTVTLATEVELELNGRLDAETDGKPCWRIPALPGRKSAQVMPLSPLAVSLWRRALAWPGRNAGDRVFSARKEDEMLQPGTVSQTWARWRDIGDLPPGTAAHDLRRTARSWWSGLPHGQGRDAMERLLGHAVGGRIERIYDRALYLPQQRAVADAWGAWLTKAVAAPANPRQPRTIAVGVSGQGASEERWRPTSCPGPLGRRETGIGAIK
jgi:hypothetical protein